MNIKSLVAKPYANLISNKIHKEMETALEDQQNIFKQLIKTAKGTRFGKDHGFESIQSYQNFIDKVPVRDYEEFKPYIEQIKAGSENVLWKGKPIYLAKTSGTTSGTKYIPITKDSISNHIQTARNALLCYISEKGNASFTSGKMIFLSGSPVLERVGGIPTGRLSGIVNHHIPVYLKGNQLPRFETNCIEDWETKLDKIVEETIHQNMTLISGIPPWMQMYFDKIIERTGKKVGEVFPNFNLMVQGGVNFEPYKNKLYETIGRKIDTVELFPASEGFFAFQIKQNQTGLLLNTNSGIFYEFIPADEIGKENPARIRLNEVEIGVNYALIINSNAGLWGYNLGDTIKFVSLKPYLIVVTGRVKHFISAFGEHVIGEEIEKSILAAIQNENAKVTEFTVAPMVQQGEGKSYHEWFIEFEKMPENINHFAQKIDEELRKRNNYYDDLIKGNILQPLKIRPVRKNTFIDYMKSIGKLGGQNKLPRLSNDRKIADAMHPYLY